MAQHDGYYSDGYPDDSEPGPSNRTRRFIPEEFAAQPVAHWQNGAGQPRAQSRHRPDPRHLQPSQGTAAESYDAPYPPHHINYPPTDIRQETFPPPGLQPTYPHNIPPQQQQQMPPFYGQQPNPPYMHPLGLPPFHHPGPFYPPAPQPQPLQQPLQQPSPPPTEPSEAESSIRQLRDLVSLYRAKDERQRIEKEVREECEAQIRQLKEQLGKAEQDVSRALAQGKKEGEMVAWERFKSERLAELEEGKRQKKLEAERPASTTRPEARERRRQQSQRQEMDFRLERLEDSMRILQERLLRDPRPKKRAPAATEDARHGLESVMAELRALRSDFRQVIVMSDTSQQNTSVSSGGRNSTFSSDSQSRRRQWKGVSDSDTSPPRSRSPLPRDGNQAGLSEPPPPAPDAPRRTYRRDEDEEDMTNRRRYHDGGWSQTEHDHRYSGPDRPHDSSHKRGSFTPDAHPHSSYGRGRSGAARGEQYEQKDHRHGRRTRHSFQESEHPIEESMGNSSPSSYRNSLGSYSSPNTEDSSALGGDHGDVKPTAFP
ncbi:uncharacterized protein NECHADRAFT_78329 [Fusarium vanettenii 77-13-4]|uniref:Uncharacterized protein n=1 Tax=Fusarium vanettenii (strain ATCC MYA-4622 / CBS 123669 / FGSC 9596 / NRRL 45880 / 77-13-4) TaxID=660122 RepID=C7ZFH9_FUSV7|nr:uncharacterized protein NECHADRAFT_78329 [Fusarium vanettenii 77-13-4]EEU37246.1 predicted protein [Fusarium vanettenii 77-13-4]